MSVASIAWVGHILRYPCLVKLPPGPPSTPGSSAPHASSRKHTLKANRCPRMTVSVASAKPTGRGPLQPAVRPYTPASPLPVLLEKEPTVSKKLEEGTMYAVIKTGGKQYRVSDGDNILSRSSRATSATRSASIRS